MGKETDIPKIPHAFFRWYCRNDRYEELHGDLEEYFYERVEYLGVAAAKRYYILDVIRCCQPYAWKTTQRQNSNIIMFKNYYKTSIRSLMKNPLSSFINLTGLSVAIGICVLAYAFIRYAGTVDQFHENKNEVYLTTFFADRDGTLQQNGRTPRPLAEALDQDFAKIKRVCRVEDRNVVVKYGKNTVFHERIRFVDPEFLEMLTFPLKWGDFTSLQDINNIILSEDMSIKYFGQENPVGQSVQVIFGENNKKVFKISGVAVDFPGARSIGFNFLVNFENLKNTYQGYDLNDWGSFVNATLVQVENPSDIPLITEGMEKYRLLQNDVQKDWAISSFKFESLATLYKNSGHIRHDISNDEYMIFYNSSISFIIIGLFVILLASVNYINIAMVSAAKRLKEIGLRKVIGASRKMVIIQFLGENILVMSIALLIGVVLGIAVFIPWLETAGSFSMDFNLYDRTLWIVLPGILLFTAFVSGAYPAFYISKFQAASIFKGSFSIGKKSRLTKIFLGFQLTLACILISIAVMFTQNNIYQNNRSWGYDQNSVIYAHVQNQSDYERLYGAMHQIPAITSISGSRHHIGKNHSVVEIDMPDRKYEVDQLLITPAYFKTIGLELKEGRLFDGRQNSERTAVMVNESFVENMKLKSRTDTSLKVDSVHYQVVGVVKDFHSYSFYTEVRPIIFKIADVEDYRYLSMRVRPGAEKETYKTLQANWSELFPEIPFDGGYQQDIWGGFHEDMNFGSRFWRALASMVLLLASLGIYGLVTLNVSGRVKEFSIRKVLGAGLRSLTVNIGKQYVIVFAVALVLGTPASYYLVKFIWGLFYVYHMPLDYSFFGFSLSILILVLVTVILSQIKSLSKANPVDGLKID
ncbi:MAG: FtsX-like permease family protein [Bacteroidota bacterium]